jgi:hypothetical protein
VYTTGPQNFFCFGNPAIPGIGTRGFPSPDYSGFGFIGNVYLSNLAYYSAILVPNQGNGHNHLIPLILYQG